MRDSVVPYLIAIAFLFVLTMWCVWRMISAESDRDMLRIELAGERKLNAAHVERLTALRQERDDLVAAIDVWGGATGIVAERDRLRAQLEAIRKQVET